LLFVFLKCNHFIYDIINNKIKIIIIPKKFIKIIIKMLIKIKITFMIIVIGRKRIIKLMIIIINLNECSNFIDKIFYNFNHNMIKII